MPNNHLEGKKILVTGGSRGIGAGIAKCLAEEGAQIAITYTSRPDAAENVVKSLSGSGHISLKMNIAETDSVAQGMSEVFERFSSLDGLVNNAGITRDQLMLRMKDEDFDQVIQTNLRGAFLCTRAVLKPMMKARSGSIVNISSVIGQMGNPGQANYAASKAGLEGFSRSVAQEIATRGIRVNCVAPGFIVTEMTDELNEKQQEAIKSRIPMNRLGSVEDIGSIVEFLLSDKASYITGQTIHVNGGLYM